MARQKVVFVTDACLSFRLARMLAGFHEGHPLYTFKALRDLVPEDTKDASWLNGELPNSPPHVVITRDDVLDTPGQLIAWRQGGHTIVVLDGAHGNISKEAQAAALLKWLPTILRTVDAHPRKRAFSIPHGGTPGNLLPVWARVRKKRRRVRKKAVERQRVERSRPQGNLRQASLFADHPTGTSDADISTIKVIE